MPVSYSWKRFWCPRDGKYALLDGGYLSDPETKWGAIFQPDAKTFEAISDAPCLVLIGEPGIGKTFALESERNTILAKLQPERETLLWPDLALVDSAAEFRRVTTETTEFQAWTSGARLLHLYIDGIDEALERVETLGAHLMNELRKGDVQQLRLRISCRAAEWRDGVEDDLRRVFGAVNVSVYELLPLRRADVRTALVQEKLEPEAFFEHVLSIGAEPLAIRPVTLRFLIESYKRGEMPSSQQELYEQGCLYLAQESSHRRDTGLAGALSAAERLAIAKRIAACTVLSGRGVLLIGGDDAAVAPATVRSRELAGGTEKTTEGGLIAVTEAAVAETLRTGLFTARGPRQLGWAHETYAEYLAARYLVDRKLELPQLLGFLIHPEDPSAQLIPQLHGLAAWVATMRPDVFRHIVEREPDVITTSAVAISRDEDRALLVERILLLQEANVRERLDVMKFGSYRKVAHPNLARQVLPYITDPQRDERTRTVAIDLAEYGNAIDALPALIERSLDSSENYYIRTQAAHAVVAIGDEQAQEALAPLLDVSPAADPDDTLKGLALRALWPKHISAADLFARLRPPQRASMVSAYHVFLNEEIASHLSGPELCVALEWVKSCELAMDDRARLFTSDPLTKLANEILWRAKDCISDGEIARLFAEVVMNRLLRHETVFDHDRSATFKDQLLHDVDRRRAIARLFIKELDKRGRPDPLPLLYGDTAFLRFEDREWLLSLLGSDLQPGEEALIVEAIVRLTPFVDPAAFQAVADAAARSSVLASRLATIVAPVSLTSSEADSLRRNYRDEQEFLARKEEPRHLVDPPPEHRVRSLLAKFEEGDADAWWKLNLEMMLEPDSSHYPHELVYDIVSMPVWKAADQDLRSRLVAAAERYLFIGDPANEEWLGQNVTFRPATAGARSLVLLKSEDPARYRNLPPEIWKKWTAAVLGSPVLNAPPLLLEDVYAHAPDEAVRVLDRMMRDETAKHGYAFTVDRLATIWDERVADAVLSLAMTPSLADRALESLLRQLLERSHARSREFAESLVARRDSDRDRERAVVAAAALISATPEESWNTWWAAVSSDHPFGRDVAFATAHEDRHRYRTGSRLSERHAAALFCWLMREFPPETDPEHEGVYSPSLRDEVGQWRNGLLRALRDRGTSEACAALRQIATQFADRKYLSDIVLEAERIRRAKSWPPVSIAEVRQIADSETSRLVRNEAQLLDVVVASLSRLQAKLQGPTPAAAFLWNESGPPGKKTREPKDENSLSNFVKLHLEQDLRDRGIVINREVEIRRGEKTDIYVDAISDGGSRLTVVIESKGCWNKDLFSSIETQLVDRYLRESGIEHGVYLVGWYVCDAWTAGLSRLSCCPTDVNELRTRLDRQALSLANRARIEPVILDATLRTPVGTSRKKSRAKRRRS